jgi:hypothetical protein
MIGWKVRSGCDGNPCGGTKDWLLADGPMCVRANPLPAPSAQLLMRLVLCGEEVLRTLRWSSVVRRGKRETTASE